MNYQAYLTCKDDLFFDGTDLMCTAGNDYEVIEVTVDDYYVIYNNNNERHLFSKNPEHDAYFGQWFELVLYPV